MAQASAEKLEHIWSAEKESGLNATESSWLVRQSRFWQKEQSSLSKAPNRKMAESQGEREPLLGEKEGLEREHEEKEWTPQRRKTGFKEEREGKQ